MQVQHTHLNEIKLVGICAQTSYTNESKIYEDPNFAYGTRNEDSKITPCVMKYFHEGLSEQIPNRLNPGKTFCVYTEYESDYTGAYKYFIGEEVNSFETYLKAFQLIRYLLKNMLSSQQIQDQCPAAVIDAWKEIWKTSDEKFGAPREYHSDFEVYDERASDHMNVIVDLFIGIKTKSSVES